MLERLGLIHLISKQQSKSYPEANLHKKRIWLHALSVGEVKSALPLVNAVKDRYLNNPNYELVITASTKTGFDMAQQLFVTPFEKNNKSNSHVMLVQVGYFPFDFYFSVKSICSRVDPWLVIIVESDLWPCFLWYMKDKKIPVFLVNARLSKSSFNGYTALKKISLFYSIFSLFEKIMVQTEIDKDRFLQIGVPEEKVIAAGNIKFDQPIPRTDIPYLDKFKNNTCIYIVAGSTHEGEEEVIVSVFNELKEKLEFKEIKLIIAPRDPKRASNIRKLLTAKSAEADCKYRGCKNREIIEEIIIIDTMGILSSLYSICDIAFVGGSLVPCGGHNPLEPAVFSKPVIFGQYTDDFKEITDTMLSNNAAFRVKDKKELLETISMLIQNRELASRAGGNAYNLVIEGKGAVNRIIFVIFENMENIILKHNE